MIGVLFVCTGNICRSPMADAVFQHLVQEVGLSDKIAVDSAGTGDWHVGEQAHEGTLAVLRKRDFGYSGRSRQLDTRDFSLFHYILAMDRANLTHILRIVNRGEWTAQEKLSRFYAADDRPEVALFLSYANRAGTASETDVPDPYYDGRFEAVYDLVYRGCVALLDTIRAQRCL